MCQLGNFTCTKPRDSLVQGGDVGSGVPLTWVPISAEMHTKGVLLFRILERRNEVMPGVGPVFGVWKYMFIELDSG